jgi:hypothetical protein
MAMDINSPATSPLLDITLLIDQRDQLYQETRRTNLHLLIALAGFIAGLILCQASAWVFGGLLLVFSGAWLVYLAYFKLQARHLIENLNLEIQSLRQMPRPS